MSYPGKPPFDLVQLSTLPESAWLGRAVFHPMEQRGDEAIWTITPEDRADAIAAGEPISDDEWDTVYDVGVVTEWAPDLIRDPDGQKIRRIPALRQRLSDGRVCQGAVTALDAALKEWRAEQG